MEINKIYNEDCLEGMKRIPDSSIDLIVTSPPYNIKKKYKSYKDDLSLQEYLTFLKEVLCECSRILKAKGNVMFNVGSYIDKQGNAIPISYFIFNMLDDLGLKFRQEIVWYFQGGLSATKKLSARYENILWLYKEDYIFNLDDIRIKEWKQIDKRNNPNGKNPTNVWEINRVAYGSKEKTEHPAQFPITMIERLIKGWSNENDIVLDPFMGSGTTAIAAINTNRNYIGFEMDEEYYKASIERINNHVKDKQIDLFEILDN